MAVFKKLKLSAASALLIGCFCPGVTSCTSGDGPDGGDEILVTAGVPRVAGEVAGTRSVVAGDVEFTAGIAGWETSGSPVYSSGTTWQTRFRAKANPTSAAVTLETRQHYNSSSSVKTYMKAWYPDGALANGTVDFTSCTEYKGDGTLDPLLAREIFGTKTDRYDKTLRFEHLTTQLIFKVKSGDGSNQGKSIEKIEIMNAKVPDALDIVNETLSGQVKTLTVPGVDGTTVVGATPEGDVVGEPVMLMAPQGKNLTLRITTSESVFDNITVTIDGDADFLVGKAYEITLTFYQLKIQLGASVTDWITDAGSAFVN